MALKSGACQFDLWWVHVGVLTAYILIGAVIAQRALRQRLVP